jgi:geranylgeranyl pyrophosphate synthase
MNDPLLARPAPTPLSCLVEAQFSEAELLQLLGPVAAGLGPRVWARALATPLADFVARPGKGFRQNLVHTSFALAGGDGACPHLLPLIVEVLHCGSLVVDDIQDQSATRRGAPSLHVEYGLPVALNVGNWMYFWAFALLERVPLPADRLLQVHRTVSRTLLGCHHGQGLDLTANVRDLRQDQVAGVVTTCAELKTGALMELAARLGAIAAGSSACVQNALGQFGRSLGVALQMLDDLGGLVSDRRCHKGHEDLRLGRPTWPFAWLAEESSATQYAELEAMSEAVQAGDLHPELLAQELVERLHGQGRNRSRRTQQRASRDQR